MENVAYETLEAAINFNRRSSIWIYTIVVHHHDVDVVVVFLVANPFLVVVFLIQAKNSLTMYYLRCRYFLIWRPISRLLDSFYQRALRLLQRPNGCVQALCMIFLWWKMTPTTLSGPPKTPNYVRVLGKRKVGERDLCLLHPTEPELIDTFRTECVCVCVCACVHINVHMQHITLDAGVQPLEMNGVGKGKN